jgi:hypothetical protein
VAEYSQRSGLVFKIECRFWIDELRHNMDLWQRELTR